MFQGTAGTTLSTATGSGWFTCISSSHRMLAQWFSSTFGIVTLEFPVQTWYRCPCTPCQPLGFDVACSLYLLDSGLSQGLLCTAFTLDPGVVDPGFYLGWRAFLPLCWWLPSPLLARSLYWRALWWLWDWKTGVHFLSAALVEAAHCWALKG